MKKINYYEVPTFNGQSSYTKYYSDWDDWLLPSTFKRVYNADDADFLIFTGGADVDPIFYNENSNSYTSSCIARDNYEAEVFAKYVNKKPFVGYCRGAQFLTVMSGGKLIQHFSGHSSPHNMITDQGIIQVNSTHHQMMFPYNMDDNSYLILGGCMPLPESQHLGGEDTLMPLPTNFVEPEAVFYPKSKAIGFQFHPEWDSCPKEGKDWSRQQILKHLFNK